MRKQSLEWKKIFSSHIFNKELVSRTYKEFLQHNKKKKQITQLEIGQWLEYISNI